MKRLMKLSIIIVLLMGMLPAPAAAAPMTWIVNATDDGNDGVCDESHCSLREAVLSAASGDQIAFDLTLPATITLGGSEIFIDKDLTITGPGADQLAVSGNGLYRIFRTYGYPNSISVTISGLTIRDGVFAAGFGGGITSQNTTLVLNDCVIGPNNNTDHGGGLIAMTASNVTLNRCTISGNEATGSNGGGGIYVDNSIVTLVNSTVSGNVADYNGGGITASSTGTVNLVHSTVTGNTANADIDTNGGGGGLYLDASGVATIQNSIIAGNADLSTDDTPWPDVYGTVTSLGGNLIGDNTGSSGWSAGDQVGTSTSPIDPLLAALGLNAPGTTPTHALQAGSPAIDAVTCAVDVTTDQRGVARPQGSACDIGAYEFAGSTKYLTMAVTPAGGGTTTPAVGVHTYAQDSDVPITATPAEGYWFNYWSPDDTPGYPIADPSAASTNVTMGADYTVTAHFAPIVHTLTVNTVGNGTVTKDPDIIGPYNYGTAVELTAIPDSGWLFDGWSGDLSGLNNPETITMDADKSVTATFTTAPVDVLLVASDDDTEESTDLSWSRSGPGSNPTISTKSGDYMARLNSYDYSGATRLQTGELNLSSYSAPQLSFYMSHDNSNANNHDNIQIQVSTDHGTNWTNVGDPIQRVDLSCTNPCWQQHSVLLSEYKKSSVYIGFLGDSFYGSNIYLDDVMLKDGETPIFEQGFETAVPPTGWSQASVPWGGGTLERALEAYGDLGAVDRFDAYHGTPTLAELQAYDVVLTWKYSGYYYKSNTSLGDVLAEYVDGGGKVINLNHSMYSSFNPPNALGGKFVDESYTALALSESTAFGSTNLCMGSFDSSHPVMQGVTDVCDSFEVINGLTRTSGTSLVASWSNGEPLVAVKNDHTVVSINAYIGLWQEYADDKYDLVHNAILWLVTPPILVNATDDVDDGACDETHCSLREAVLYAASGNTVEFDLTLPATIILGGKEILIDKDLTIAGPGADQLAVSGNEASRVFRIYNGGANIGVTISGLTVRDGRAAYGGGIISEYGSTLVLNDCVIGPNNIVTDAGGGLSASNSTVTLNRCTVTGNHGTGSVGGAGIYSVNDASVTLVNSTISGNVTNNDGGGITAWSGGTVNLLHSTVTENTANLDYATYPNGGGGGLYVHAFGQATIQNSIIAGNDDLSQNDTPGPDVLGTVSSLGGNLIGDDTGSSGWIAGDQVGTTASPIDPLLGALALNAPGTTPTHALLVGSPAIDTAPSCVVATDQRGVARPQGSSCDIGAYELQVPPGDFSKTYPTDSATGVPTNPTLTWEASSGADSYKYCFAAGTSCNPNIETTSTSAAISGLLNNTFYYWQVQAFNDAGDTYSNVGAMWAFTTAALPDHTVTFYANGGSDTMAPQTSNVPAALMANNFTRTGFTFSGWNTASDGTGDAYIDGATYDFSTDMDLYAQWTANTYTVTFDANGGSTPTPTSKLVTYDSTYGSLATTGRTGYTFNGWFTAASGGTQVMDATVVATASDHTLYAQWTANTYTVTFDANGGSTPTLTSKVVTYDSTYGSLATTSRTCYTFSGWFTATSSGTLVTDATVVATASDHTLYAQWTINTACMSVSNITVTNKAGPKDNTITGLVTIIDSQGAALSKAAVTVKWYQNENLIQDLKTSPTSITRRGGVAKFVLRKMPDGDYKMCVVNVMKEGYDWESTGNLCYTLTVP